jgi:hypothetical protein
MTNSPVRRMKWIAVSFVLTSFALSPVESQTIGETGPVDLAAPSSLNERAPVSGPRRLTPRAASPVESAPQRRSTVPLNTPVKVGIEVDRLGKVDTESVGVLTTTDGGLGGGMWKGLTRSQAVEMVASIPTKSNSAALRDVVSQILLSRARAPLAVSENAPSLLAARAAALLAIGDVDGAELLLSASPTQERPQGLDIVDANLQIIRFNNARACGLARNNVASAGKDFWQRLLIYCDALEGKVDSVGFGMSLLRETSGDDPAMVKLVDSVLSGLPIILEKIGQPNTIHIALSRVAKVELPTSISESDNPILLHAVAMTPNLSIGARIEAAERAISFGSLSPAQLRQLYEQVTYSEVDLANSLTRASEIGGAAARALLYQAAVKQNIPTARAEIISSALGFAREDGRYQAAVEAFRPLINKLPPSPEMVWFALTGVRAFLALGEPVATDRWMAYLRASATVSEDAKVALARTRPLVRLLGGGDRNVPLETVLTEWLATVEDAPQLVPLRSLLNGLFVALGEDLSDAAWAGIDTGGPKNQLMPPTDIWFQFRNSMRAFETAKASQDSTIDANSSVASGIPVGAAKPAILALRSIGNGGPGAQGVAVVFEVVAALKSLGMERAARQLAVETVLAAGL